MESKTIIISRVKLITTALVDQGYLNGRLEKLKNFPLGLTLVDDNDINNTVQLWAKTIYEQVLMGLPYHMLLDMAKNDNKISWISDLISLLQK